MKIIFSQKRFDYKNFVNYVMYGIKNNSQGIPLISYNMPKIESAESIFSVIRITQFSLYIFSWKKLN